MLRAHVFAGMDNHTCMHVWLLSAVCMARLHSCKSADLRACSLLNCDFADSPTCMPHSTGVYGLQSCVKRQFRSADLLVCTSTKWRVTIQRTPNFLLVLSRNASGENLVGRRKSGAAGTAGENFGVSGRASVAPPPPRSPPPAAAPAPAPAPAPRRPRCRGSPAVAGRLRAGVARARRGRGAGMSCDPYLGETATDADRTRTA
eukprot:gene14675-biopygen17116